MYKCVSCSLFDILSYKHKNLPFEDFNHPWIRVYDALKYYRRCLCISYSIRIKTYALTVFSNTYRSVCAAQLETCHTTLRKFQQIVRKKSYLLTLMHFSLLSRYCIDRMLQKVSLTRCLGQIPQMRSNDVKVKCINKCRRSAKTVDSTPTLNRISLSHLVMQSFPAK